MGTLEFGLHDILIMRGRMQKEKEENIWRRKIIFLAEAEKNGEGKGGEEKQRRKKRNIFGDGKFSFFEEIENGEGKGGKYLAEEMKNGEGNRGKI